MSAIFKREFRSYMNNVIGYAVIAFLLLFAGGCIIVNNVLMASAHFEYTVSMLQMILIVAIPVLAMRSVADEKRSRVDRLIYSLPIKMSSVVLGKYFAMLAVFSIACGIMALYPLMLRLFGLVAMSAAYVSLLAFWLLGAALLAFCLFVSTLTESQLAAVLLGIGGVVVLYALDSVSYLLPMSGVLAEIVTSLCMFSRFSQMCNGLFDVTTVIFDVSFAVLFLYLAYQMMERKRRR